MPTPSEQTPTGECGAPKEVPHRSIFENYQPEDAGQAEQPASDGGFGPIYKQPRGEAKTTGRQDACPTERIKSAVGSAVARSFLYRFIAKAFEDAEPEGWQSLCDEAQQASFWSAVRALAEGAPLNLAPAARRLLDHLKPDGYTVFESDYITGFGHTVRGDCPMNEIEYGDIKADPLFQPHRLADLGAFYAAFGLEIGNDAAERQDHISIELEFMSVLAAKEAYALAHKFDDEQVTLVRDAQKKFLREHLGRWTPAFTRRLSRIAGDCALGALADFTREFITAECASLNVMPGSEDLLLRPIDDSLETLCASCGITSLPPGATSAPVET